jgi:hypothetical protein
MFDTLVAVSAVLQALKESTVRAAAGTLGFKVAEGQGLQQVPLRAQQQLLPHARGLLLSLC